MPTNPNLLVSPKQRQGGYYEHLALMFLQAQGLQLIAQNWQQPKVGELDLIMQETGQAWDTLVFIEVRQRAQSGYGDALMSVTPAKQRKLIKTARYFMQKHGEYANLECRFDVVAFNGSPNQSTGEKATGKTSLALTQQRKSQKSAVSPDWVQGAFMASAW